jgi:hypothetical protein
MTHNLRFVVDVAADSKEEAKEKAYQKSFDDDFCGWEEWGTSYDHVCEIRELSEGEEENY